MISDSSMFSEIDCEIDSDFRLSWRFHPIDSRIQFHFSDFTFALFYFSGSRLSDWDDKSKRFLGGGVRSKYALRKRWTELRRKNLDSVGSARKKPSRATHTYDVVGGRGWVKKRRTSTSGS